MILMLSDISDFKKDIADRFSAQIHFHDGCGGQYFTLDETDNELKNYIEAYFSKKNLQADFSDDGLHFVVKNRQN